MNIYLLTSKMIEGEIEFRFGADGFLVYFQSRAQLTEEQSRWILANMPVKETHIEQIRNMSKTMHLTRVTQHVSFDDFWNRYDHKAVSSKKKTQAAWERLSKAEQIKAYNYIPRYFSNIPAGVAKKYAETYLNSQLWNN